MQQKLNREDKLFSKFSHDLRGSFVSILGYTELLNDPAEKITKQEINEFAKRIDSRTKEAYDLLDNFINWLKLEQYNKKLLAEENFLFDCIVEVISHFNKIFSEKKIVIVNDIAKRSKVFIDLQILQGILKNIFFFISKNILDNTTLKIGYVAYSQNIIIKYVFSSNIDKYQTEALLTLQDSNNIDVPNIPNEIIFAKKFVELSNGKFELIVGNDSKAQIILSLPK